MKEVQQLREIEEDIRALEERAQIEEDRAVHVPEFIMDERMRQEWIMYEKISTKYLTIDINDSGLLPPYPNRGPDFDERLRMNLEHDIDELIEQNKKEFIEIANKGRPFEQRDTTKKDEDLVRKMNILANAVEVPHPPVAVPDLQQIIARR